MGKKIFMRAPLSSRSRKSVAQEKEGGVLSREGLTGEIATGGLAKTIQLFCAAQSSYQRSPSHMPSSILELASLIKKKTQQVPSY